jgi:hypothetical protein
VSSQKGVCRHRSFAFVVTALALGLPARMVRNEAHAWVEVSDSLKWHRIDLGGAAGRVNIAPTDRPAHIAPRDPYAWPSGSDSAEAMAEQARSRARTSVTPSSGSGSGTAPPSGSGPSGAATVTPLESDPGDLRPASDVTLGLREPRAVRGARLPVFGVIEAAGDRCSLARVDLHLRPKASSGRTEAIALGALVTGEDGRYDGQVAVPYGIPVGDYDVVASTPGSYRCGRGASR